MSEVITYRDFEITPNPPEARQYRYGYVHENYDGPEDNRGGHCETIDQCKDDIDEWWEENPDLEAGIQEFEINTER